MGQRKYKTDDYPKELEKYVKEAPLSGKARKLIEIGGKPIKLPKKILHGVEESYFPYHRK